MNNLTQLESAELQAIEPSKAQQIREVFTPMADMLERFEEAYALIVRESKLDITDDVIAKAKRLRLDIGKIRTDAEKARKAQKEEHLRAGQAVDSVCKILTWAIAEKEAALKSIEEHFERKEKERLEILQQERVVLIDKYVENAGLMDLVSMGDDVWAAYLSTKMNEYKDKIQAEKDAAAAKVKKEKEEAEERKRLQIENESLKAEQKIKDEAQAVKDAAEADEREAERLKHEAVQAKLKAEIAATKEKERLVQVELDREKADKAQAERDSALAPDKEKLMALAVVIASIHLPILQDAKAQAIADNVNLLLGKVLTYINESADTL